MKNNVKNFLVGLLLVLVIGGGYIGLMALVSRLIENALIATILDIAVKIVVGICAILIVKFKFLNGKIGLGAKGIFVGLFIYGAMLWIYIILNYIAGKCEPDRTMLEAMPYVVLYLTICIGIGFAEEMIFRGVVFNFFRKNFGESKRAIILAILLSSIMFGLCHLLNLISKPHMVVSTITQIIYATIIGAYFAVIYYKSGNLWAPTILHVVFDFVYYIWFAFSNEAIVNSNVDITIASGVMSIVLYIPIIVWTILCFIGLFDFCEDNKKVG